MMVYQIYYYMSAIRVYYVFVGYIFSLFICGQIICNIFELRLFLYLTVSKWLLLVPRFWMNIAIYGVLIVERLINIFGIQLIYIAIYIRLKYQIYQFQCRLLSALQIMAGNIVLPAIILLYIQILHIFCILLYKFSSWFYFISH